MKYVTYLLCILLFASCSTNSTATENEATSEAQIEEANTQIENDLLTEFGLIISVEDGAYPMFLVTINFPERKFSQSFNLNAEDLEPPIENLGMLQGQYATIKYTSDLSPNLLDLRQDNKVIMGSGKIDPSWKSITGRLSGAAEITNSDLPGSIQISKDGEILEFDYYVDEEMKAVNGQLVTASYKLESNNVIKSIIPSEEKTTPKSTDRTTTKAPPITEVIDEELPSNSMMVESSYLILQSTTSYSAAAFTAKQASEQLGLPIDNRGYVFDFKAGLKDTAACDCGEMHGYLPRGDFGDKKFISIEHTNGYPEFTDGLYIVVAAVGNRSNINSTLANAKEHFPDAYVKDATVYEGCMH